MSKELEKVISKLSQKSKPKVVEPEPEDEAEKQAEADLRELTHGDAIEDDEKPVPEKPTDEAMKKIREIETQVERLQNNGVYRVEMLYQLQRIGDFLEKLVGGDDGEEKS